MLPRAGARTAVVPHTPRRLPPIPEPAQQLDVADRVRALPETVVVIDAQLAIRREALERLALEHAAGV